MSKIIEFVLTIALVSLLLPAQSRADTLPLGQEYEGKVTKKDFVTVSTGLRLTGFITEVESETKSGTTHIHHCHRHRRRAGRSDNSPRPDGRYSKRHRIQESV